MSHYSSDREAKEVQDFDDEFVEGNQDAKIKGEYLDEYEESDYREMDELDQYNEEELDHEVYSEMSINAR